MLAAVAPLELEQIDLAQLSRNYLVLGHHSSHAVCAHTRQARIRSCSYFNSFFFLIFNSAKNINIDRSYHLRTSPTRFPDLPRTGHSPTTDS